MGSSFCKLVKDVFKNINLPSDLNSTLLVLIPKLENPTSLRMYRHISLCNVTYKTITKIIANILQTILHQLVGPHQTSFVPGRYIMKNIVVAQDIVHSMRKKTGPRGFMAIKVDLEKAYDRLSWEFINETLSEARIPPELIQVIMACITSTSMRVLWKGETTDTFIPSRGICQGDPLSPYIFVLCIEHLSHGILNAVDAGKWRPITLARNGILLSHLFFADNLLLLTEASAEQAQVISLVLESFCYSSDSKVNKNKTLLYFSKNVDASEAAAISGLLGFSVTEDLGVLLQHSRVSNSMYNELVEKMEKRLSGWTTSHISLAGHITLTQSVLQAIPIYVMQIVMLLDGVRDRIDRACRRFI